MMQQQYTVAPRKINLIIHYNEEEIPLIVYRGTSEQAIFENIRDLTNLYRFRCLNKKKQPIILSSSLPDKTHIFVVDPNAKEIESDEPTPEEQVNIISNKIDLLNHRQSTKYPKHNNNIISYK